MKENPVAKIPERVVSEIRKHKNVVLLTHAHPDGDALGSLLGARAFLTSLGKNVFCFLEEPVSHLYDFLPGATTVSSNLDEYHDFIEMAEGDLLHIALDCGDSDRLGRFAELFLQAKTFVVLDHHQSHRDFGTCRWVEADRSSTGEMVFELGMMLGADLSYEGAFCLYVAICTDTGSFRYECTRPRTLQIAAELLGYGVRPEEVGHHLYDNYSRERLKLMELVLATLELHHDNRLAFMYVSSEMLLESGASMQDVEGFIDLPRSLRSVDVAALVKQSRDGTISVSMRAKGACDVAGVAKKFGGGGHRNAAGFRLENTTITTVQSELEKVLDRELEGSRSH